MRIKETSFTTFDLETTGLFASSGDAICEIGALRFDSGEKEKTFEVLVDPVMPISPGAYKMNRITPEMLEGKPKINEVLPGFMEFIKGSVLVAYNARFDISFLAEALGVNKVMLNDYLVVDVLEIARDCFDVAGGYSLGNVAAYFGIEQSERHRALPDVVSTWKIFNKAIPLLSARGIENVDDIARVYSQSGETVLDSGGSVATILSEAIKSNLPLRIRYKSSWKKNVTERTITPLRIKGEYVYSFCHLRREKRTFLISCIEIV